MHKNILLAFDFDITLHPTEILKKDVIRDFSQCCTLIILSYRDKPEILEILSSFGISSLFSCVFGDARPKYIQLEHFLSFGRNYSRIYFIDDEIRHIMLMKQNKPGVITVHFGQEIKRIEDLYEKCTISKSTYG